MPLPFLKLPLQPNFEAAALECQSEGICISGTFGGQAKIRSDTRKQVETGNLSDIQEQFATGVKRVAEYDKWLKNESLTKILWIYLMKPKYFLSLETATCNAHQGALKGAKLFGVRPGMRNLEQFLDTLRALAADQLDATKFPHCKLRMWWLHVLCELSKNDPWRPREGTPWKKRLEIYKKAYEKHCEADSN